MTARILANHWAKALASKRGWLAALALAGLVSACSSARRGEPIAGPLRAGPRVEHGRIVFMQKCHSCHPGGEAGLGPALNNKPAPSFLIKTQVRAGLGAMPAFDSQKLPASDLDALVEYLKTLRKHPQTKG